MKNKIKAGDIMSRDIISVVPGSPLNEAAELMRKNNIGAIPVVSGGQLKGIVTDRDIVLRCISMGSDPKQMKAEDIMSSNVAYVSPDRSVWDILNLMAAEQVRRIPVVQDGVLQGMVSMSDIALSSMDTETDQVLASTLEEISETPRWQVYGDEKLREKHEKNNFVQ